jgi:hypothetical protein
MFDDSGQGMVVNWIISAILISTIVWLCIGLVAGVFPEWLAFIRVGIVVIGVADYKWALLFSDIGQKDGWAWLTI